MKEESLPDEISIRRLLDEGQIWVARRGESKEELSSKLKEILECRPRDDNKGCGEATFGVDEIDSELPQHGLAFGSLHEWFCHVPPVNRRGKDLPDEAAYPPSLFLSLIIGNGIKRLAAQAAGPSAALSDGKFNRFIVWIGKNIWPTPFILEKTLSLAGGNLLSNCIFIDPPDQKLLLWSLEMCLRSPAVAAVSAECRNLKFALSQRLSLAARQGGALGLIVRQYKSRSEPSAAASRWLVEPRPSPSGRPCFNLQLLKCKGRRPVPDEWLVEFQERDGDDETVSLHVLPAVGRDAGAKRSPPAGGQTRLSLAG